MTLWARAGEHSFCTLLHVDLVSPSLWTSYLPGNILSHKAPMRSQTQRADQ